MSRYSWVGYVVGFIILGIVLGFVFTFFLSFFYSLGSWPFTPDLTVFASVFWVFFPLCMGAGFLLSLVLVGCVALKDKVCG